jgi:uncharacterized protein YgbK (DUF1537 family)
MAGTGKKAAPLMGVAADDVTGANDIGIMFAKSGCLAHVYSFTEEQPRAVHPSGQAAQIVILDTNSRLDAPGTAYGKVFAATQALREMGCRRFFNKTCSVFRGNIGAEFDAMLDALGREFAVVVLGFPKNGRTTVDGIHTVHGKRLEESEFRNDPIHPMTRSSLVEILQSQTKRTVGLLTHAVVERGSEELRRRIRAMRSRCNYLILDVTDQAALATIARAVHDEPVLCGSSALGEELPAVWGVPPAREERLDLPCLDGLGILIAAGSLMPQTVAQIEHLRLKGVPLFALDTLRLFDAAEREREIARLGETIAKRLLSGADAVFHTPNDRDALEVSRRAGALHGLSKTEVSRRVSEAVAEVTARVLDSSGQNRLVAAGGETAAAVCERLGVNGMRVWREIQPGLPSCLSLTDPPRMLVLKSGSFGKPDFFEQALQHLREA